MKLPVLPAVGLVALFLASGCTREDGIYFSSPEPGNNPEVVRLNSSNTADSVQAVASALRDNGFNVTRASSSSGIVEGTADGSAFVDCGVITQYALGNKSEFDGSSPLSVIYKSGETVDFVLRGVEADTRVRISIDGSVANVSENHDVTMTWSMPDGNETRTERQTVRPGELTWFEDDTACATSNRVADLLR